MTQNHSHAIRTKAGTRRPGILFLSSSWLHGDAFGGQLRALHLGRALQQFGDLHVAIVNSGVDEPAARIRTAEEFDLLPAVHGEITPARGPVEKLRYAFDRGYLNLHGCVSSAANRDRILACFPQYDLVWVLNSRTANILQIWQWPHAHLDVDDVPSTYMRTVAQNSSSRFAAAKARVQQSLLKRRERLFERRFTTVSVCSEDDRAYLGGGPAMHVIPNGFARPAVEPRPTPTLPPRIGFIGLYSYVPNQEGVEWFLRECWPAVRQALPGARFRLVGKDSDGPLQPKAPDVDALGWLAEPAAEIATWSVMVIPIRLGGGTRIKIADAFSRKCPMVSTRLGAFGYAVEDRKQLRLADSPEAFANACIELVKRPTEAAQMADRAWQEFLQRWTWDAIAPKVWAAAEDCLQRSRP